MGRFIKNLWIWILAVLILGTVFFYLEFNLPEASREAQLVISLENGESRKFKGYVMADMSILEALHSSSLGGDFELRYSIQKEGGVALAKIDGAVNLGNKSWNFYLNGRSVNVADIDKVKIKAGDLIEVKHE